MSVPPPFRKVLIANRGEIAVRVARGLRDLGIAPVAIYSDADRTSPHVRACDEAYRVGPAAASESYLVSSRIIETALAHGVEAIHPGYGFLSEDATFARAVVDAGLVWIGPPAEAMEKLGDKLSARKLAAEAGVPTVPGSGAITEDTDAMAEAERIGYPLVVKASAGGGGKGMRLVT
jgi:acetyl/propionyl-CoA carboxylase alpha subunit